MIKIISPFLTTMLGIRGISLYPFIIIKFSDKVLINHESIHIRQQKELFVFKFYYLYLKEYLTLKKRYKSHYLAYRNISFEREAFENESNLNYLKSRPKNNWKKYKIT